MKGARIWLALLLVSSCIDERTGSVNITSDPTRAGIDFVERGDDLRMVVSTRFFVETYGAGTVHVDGASVDVTIDGTTTTYDDPDIVADDFPVEGDPQFLDSTPITFEVPSPITDVDKLEARCIAAGRSMTVTTRFYATQEDRKGREDPPLVTDTFTIPLITALDPEPPNIFSVPFNVQQFAPNTSGEIPPALVVPGEGNDVLFLLEVPQLQDVPESGTTFNGFRADQDSVDQVVATAGQFREMPRAMLTPGGAVFLAGRDSYAPAQLQLSIYTSQFEEPSTQYIDVDPASVPEYSALSVAAVGRSPTGYHAVVQSAFALLLQDRTTIVPPEDKYYGSFVYELADDLTVLSVTPSDRDIIVLDTEPDGTTLLVSTELPPRVEETLLHVERTDPTGAVLWSHDEPVLVYAVEARSLPDGGVLVAYETQSPSGRVELLRLSGDDGSVVYRYAAVGSTPSIAAKGDGSAFFAFSGTDPQFEDLPSRLVPLVVELSPTGEPVRAAQVACAGWTKLANAADGSPLLIGGYAERMTLGDQVLAVFPGQVTISGIE